MNMTLDDAEEMARSIREDLAEMRIPATVSVHEYYAPDNGDQVDDPDAISPYSSKRILMNGDINIRFTVGFRQAKEWPSVRRWLQDAPFGKTAPEEER